MNNKTIFRIITHLILKQIYQIYPHGLQLNKANASDTVVPCSDLHLSVSNGFVSTKNYDKRDDFDFDIVNFVLLNGDSKKYAEIRN